VVRLQPGGKLRRVWRHREKSCPRKLACEGPWTRPETWRTPRPVGGCNKPPNCRCGENRRSWEEQQGRNVLGRWHIQAEGGAGSLSSSYWEWTRGSHVGGGAIFENRERRPDRRVGVNAEASCLVHRHHLEERRHEPGKVPQTRRRSGGWYSWSPPATPCDGTGYPRRSALPRQDHGGTAGKANDPHPVPESMKPRCGPWPQ
jgi:hypothetical protein